MEDPAQCGQMQARKRRAGEFCVRAASFRVLQTTETFFFLSEMDSYYAKKRTIGIENGGMTVSPCAKLGKSDLQGIWRRGNSSWSHITMIGSRLYNVSKSKTVGIRRAATIVSTAAERDSGEEDGSV